MKLKNNYRFLFVPLVFWAVFSAVNSYLPRHKSDEEVVHPPKAKSEIFSRENVQQRSEYMAQIIADPRTGTVPMDVRSTEMKFARELERKASSDRIKRGVQGQNLTTASDEINWAPLGPSNFGGRTRAVALDVRNENVILAGGVSGGMWRSENGGRSWVKTTAKNQLHSVTCITQDVRPGKEDTWYYGTGELIGNSTRSPGAPFRGDGIFKSTDGGRSWTALLSTQSNEPASFSSPFMYVWDIETNPNSEDDEVIAAIFGGVVKSLDGGQSWTTTLGDDRLNLAPGSNLNTIASIFFTDIHRTSNGMFYASLSSETNDANQLSTLGGVYGSSNGLNWTKIINLETSVARRTEIGSSTGNPDLIYFLTDKVNQYELRRFNALSRQVTNLSNSLPDGVDNVEALDSQNSYNLVVGVHPTNDNVVFVGGTNLYRSDDAFTSNSLVTWIGGYNPEDNGNSIYPNHHPDQHDLIFLPSDPNVLISANDGGLFKTQNSLADNVTYQSLNNGYVTTQYYTVEVSKSPNDNFAIGGLQDNGSIVSGLNALNQGVRVIGGDGGFTASTRFGVYYYGSFQNGQVYRLTFNSSFQLTSFARVDPIGSGGLPAQPLLFINPFILDPSNGNRMYFAGGDKIWINRNLSQIPSGSQERTFVNWEALEGTSISEGSISALAITTTPKNILYYGTAAGKVFRVINAHSGDYEVTEITGIIGDEAGYVNSIAINPDNGDELVVVLSNYGVKSVFHSTDGGITFSDISGNLEENPDGSGNGPSVRWVKVVPKTNGTIEYFLATSIGLFSTSNLNGVNTLWSQEGAETIGNVPTNMVDYRRFDGKIVVATHGNGLYQSQVANVTPNPTDQFGETLAVKNAFPNPFSDFVTISFEIPETGMVRARVYNDQGAQIKTIALGLGFQGENEIFWDGTNVQGQKVASGVYIIRLEYQNETKTQRVIVSNN
jgi:hypothetical protein